MSRNKTQKFSDNRQSRNVIEPGKDIFSDIRGKWSEYFKNQNPIVLELACGRGEYTVGFAGKFPGKNFLGIDIKGARIWRGSQQLNKQDLKNAAFLRSKIQDLESFFDEDEVNEIWLIHPDPRPKKSDARRRLTHPRFLEIYKQILKPGSLIHLKTDNQNLFDYTLDVLDQRSDIIQLEFTFDLHNSKYLADHHQIKTYYEERAVEEGLKINYLKFSFSE